MSDNAAAASAALPESAAAAVTPESSPGTEPMQSPAVTATPPAETAGEVPVAAAEPTEPAAPEAPAAEAEKPAEASPLLATDAAKEEPKPEAKAAEPVAPAEAPAEPIKYEFKLPEGVSLDSERLGQFTEFAGNNKISQETAQGLVDLHIGEMQKYAEHVAAEQRRVWDETRANWRKEMMGDAEFGGAAFETNRAAAVRVLDLLVPAGDRTAFNQAMMMTGMAEHPQLFRMLVRAASILDEPAPKPQGSPPPRPQGRAGNRRAQLYTNPSSPR